MVEGIIAKNICALRKQSGLTQGELSEHIHYSDKVISKWERGESVPDIEALTVLADFFKVSLDSIARDGSAAKPAAQTQPAQKEEAAPQTDKAAWDALQRVKQKKLITRGARIASPIILSLFMNVLFLIQSEWFPSEFFSSKFYFLCVVPAVLLANLIISLCVRRTFDSTEVIFLFFAFIWTAGLVVIYSLWDAAVIAPDSQKMRIWYILLFYNVIVSLSVILTGMGIKRITRKRKEKNTVDRS